METVQNCMVEEVYHKDKLFAIVLRAGFKVEGIEFFTPPELSQQLAYMNRPKGYKVKAHTHKKIERKVLITQEVLLVKAGKVNVTLYDLSHEYIREFILGAGDVILLADGGHSVEMLEDSELIEIKQGPYQADDKIFLNHT